MNTQKSEEFRGFIIQPSEHEAKMQNRQNQISLKKEMRILREMGLDDFELDYITHLHEKDEVIGK